MLIGYAALRPGARSAGVESAGVESAGVEPHSALIAAGVGRLFIDVLLNDMPRTQLDAAIDAIAAGDVLVSVSIESLARSPQDLLGIVGRLDARGGSLRVLQVAGFLALDTATVEGRAMLGALALLHSMAPTAAARAALMPREAEADQAMTGDIVTRPRGRPATALSQSDEVARLRARGLRATDIADRLGIGRASVYRIISQGGLAPAQAAPEQPRSGRAAQVANRLQQANAAD